MSSLDYLEVCRLCLVKDRVSVPIFEGEGDVRQIFLKITACLPVKVNREDKLPKKICDDCVYKVELCYQFWHTTANAEKQLLQWLGDVNMEDKQGYNVLNPNGMKQDQNNESRLDGTVMQQVSEHQNNMNMGMMDNMGLSIPMMMSNNTQQQITSVPMDNSGSSVQNVQPVAGPSTQTTHDQITQNQTDAPTQQEEEEESSEEEENSDDECDGDEGLPIKEESEEDPNSNRTIEPTTFVNVSLACDEAGPSGLQQQKITDMPEMVMQQTTDVDPKTGYNQLDPLSPTFLIVKLEDDYFRIPKSLSVFMMKEPPPTEENSSKIEELKEQERKEEKNNRVEKNQGRVETRKRNKTIIEDLDDLDDLDDAPLDFRKRRKDVLSKTRSGKNTTSLKKKSHICEICYITFDRKSKLTSHMFKHSNSRPHKCTICSKGFKTGAYLSRHMEIHDEPAQLHACTLCDFKARTKPYLKIHYIRKHTEDYNYSCEQCGKMFKVQSDYTTHMKDHDTESCVCDICGTSYPSKSSLYFHKHYKHKTKVKEFECQICRKRFKTQKNLDSHAELHKMKYVCEQCGLEFKFKYGLTKHLRTHSGEKSYLCAICGKTFGCLSSQKIHLLTHVGERPYVCDICGQSFTQRSPMMLHRKKHPGIHPPPPPIKITNLLHGVQDKIIVNKSAK
ncbi:zinc finger protein 454 isoform X4 [Solenopsis invicta]|uniref:zinc finger protein 454 isoform X4 n=1 Tax=Solenopsis invicta TaxID=13686 RepID=UPI00193E7D12|nr:zinc finger protein 454 isoform X4 [Solenopsis invicta]